jgi:hypothetical protein
MIAPIKADEDTPAPPTHRVELVARSSVDDCEIFRSESVTITGTGNYNATLHIPEGTDSLINLALGSEGMSFEFTRDNWSVLVNAPKEFYDFIVFFTNITINDHFQLQLTELNSLRESMPLVNLWQSPLFLYGKTYFGLWDGYHPIHNRLTAPPPFNAEVFNPDTPTQPSFSIGEPITKIEVEFIVFSYCELACFQCVGWDYCSCAEQTIPPIPPIPPTITDALEILKYLAGIPSIYDNSGESPTIEDAMEILKAIAGIIELPLQKK